MQDVRYALRTLIKSPGFTAVAVVSLVLGIGAKLVSLYHRFQKGSESFNSTSYPEYEFYRDHNTVFSGMLAYLRVPMILGSGANAQRISGELISPNYFTVLGIRPVVGRSFTSRETDAVAIISYSLWQKNFGADPSVVGRIIKIGSGNFTIIGVAPKQFRGIVMDWADPPAVWIPASHYAAAVPAFTFDILREWGMESYLVTGRLRPGITI